MAVDHRRGAILPLPEGTPTRVLAVSVRGVAVALLGLVGVVHLVQAPDHFAAAQYLGILFVLATAGSWAAAAGIAAGLRGAWILGAAVAEGAYLLAYGASAVARHDPSAL